MSGKFLRISHSRFNRTHSCTLLQLGKMQTRTETFWRKSYWGLGQKRPNLGRFVFDKVWSLRSFNKLPVLKICILLQEQNFESWFWNWIFADAVYCGLSSVAFQGEMVAIAAELKKGSGTTACQGVPFDLICFKLKSSSQNQNWESFTRNWEWKEGRCPLTFKHF